MSERIQVLRELAQYVFNRFERISKDLSEEELEWRPTEKSNNIRWILTHISVIINMYVPQAIYREPSYYPKDRPKDYQKTQYNFEKLLNDINSGKKRFYEDLGTLSDNDLEVMISRRDGAKTMQWCLIHYLSEISHHKGQIAFLRGTMNRLRKSD
jgi:uncharacterized damage-inducible protein DinB